MSVHCRRLGFLALRLSCLFVIAYFTLLSIWNLEIKSALRNEFSASDHVLNVRILCLVVSTRHRSEMISKTWGKQCDSLISHEDGNVFQNIFNHNGTNQFDWLIKTNDETYMLMRNLAQFLSSLDSSKPLWFTWPNIKRKASYVFSKESFRRTSKSCEDDSKINKCLERLGAILVDTRDSFGMERFIPFNAEHLRPSYPPEVFQCCSESLLAFYNVKPNQFQIIDYLINLKDNSLHFPALSSVLNASAFLGSGNHSIGSEFRENRIFFLETSGRSSLKLRHVCAVESAAKENPDRPVQLLIFNATPEADSTSMQIYANYPNIEVQYLSFEEYFKGSPFEKWFLDGRWQDSPFKVAHLSDYLRILSLWRGGGIYMDTDFVVLRSLGDLANFSCVESSDMTSNGVIGLETGHPLLEILVENMSNHYEPMGWTTNGPDALKGALQLLCNESSVELMNPEKCHGYLLLPTRQFYPIHYSQWNRYFQESGEALSQFNESYALHVWNKLSFNETVRVGSEQLYALAAARHCPHVFATAATVF